MISKDKPELDHDEIHREAIRNYESSYSAERGERDLCLADLKFALVPGSQWEDTASEARRNRPRFEINKIESAINTLVGEQKQNRTSIKLRPEDDADKTTSDILSGLIRNIEESSRFKDIKDQTFKEQATGGFGAWYITTQYKKDSFDQEAVIKYIPSAASSVFYDPSATDFLKRDAGWFLVCTDISTEDFKKRYPDAAASSLPEYSSSLATSWQDRKTTKIATYYVKVPTTKEIALLSDGNVVDYDADFKKVQDELFLKGITVVKTRICKSHKVMIYKLSASTILEKPYEWAGSHIPVVPVFGYSTWINNQHYYKGMVRNAKDAQRVYNYSTSQAIEVSALSPKDPYWMTPKQAKGHERQLRDFNNKNNPFMFYNADTENPGPPKRTGAPSVQTALLTQTQQADADIQATTGLYNPSLGEGNNDSQSGRAILALQKQGNHSTYELVDNLVKAVEWTGEILLDVIPKIYDTNRKVSILEEDGNSRQVELNGIILDTQTGQPVEINNLSKGKYKVISSNGPSFATKRSEGLNLLIKLAESNPLFSQVSADLIAKNVDFEYSEELSARVRKQLIDQGVVDPTEEEIRAQLALQPQGPPQLSVTEMMEMEMRKLNLEQQAAIVDGLELQNEKIKADIMHKYAETNETIVDAQETETKIAKMLVEDGVMVVNPSNMAARQKNLRALNQSLTEYTEEDLESLKQNPVSLNPEINEISDNLNPPNLDNQ